ncbi:hypothetical protein AH4AK4_1129 [Aeromonas hydrophila 4AK4]|nr:hypothetical protein AH4AK4_1129 [Aeromonas hydrophila 4AK4]
MKAATGADIPMVSPSIKRAFVFITTSTCPWMPLATAFLLPVPYCLPP